MKHSEFLNELLIVFDTKDDAGRALNLATDHIHTIEGNKRFSSDINHDSYVSLLGLNWIYDKTLHKDNYYISARTYNCSHDLRLLNIVRNSLLDTYYYCKENTPQHLKQDARFNDIREMFFNFFNPEIVYENDFGTPLFNPDCNE